MKELFLSNLLEMITYSVMLLVFRLLAEDIGFKTGCLGILLQMDFRVEERLLGDGGTELFLGQPGAH